MILTDAHIAEFVALCEADGVHLDDEEARVVAMRLFLLYRHLARPTPQELAEGLAKRPTQGKVSGAPDISETTSPYLP
jgi:hypothetical protein